MGLRWLLAMVLEVCDHAFFSRLQANRWVQKVGRPADSYHEAKQIEDRPGTALQHPPPHSNPFENPNHKTAARNNESSA